VQLDIYRAGFEPTPQHWQALHELYATAEASRVAESEVVDTARQGKTPTSPQAAYAEVLLLHAASPRELSSRHLVWVARWARRWARKARILTAAPGHDEESIPLHIDLAGKQPANYQPTAGSDARWLETGGIRQSLKKRLSLLDKGSTPAELQLGDDCPQPVCGQILRHVYQRWCKGGSTRKHERRAVDGTCLVVPDIEAIYFHLAGKQQFRQPGYSDDDALRRERDEMATFGSIAPSSLGGLGSQSGHHVEEWKVIEEWSVVEESATGIHATHLVDENLARINQRQLLAVQPPGANSLLIGYVRWSMVTDDNRLHIGILILPGRPEPVALRPMDREHHHAAGLFPRRTNSRSCDGTGPAHSGAATARPRHRFRSRQLRTPYLIWCSLEPDYAMESTANPPVPESAETSRYRQALASLPVTNVPLACDTI
jgi:hypothetical protein